MKKIALIFTLILMTITLMGCQENQDINEPEKPNNNLPNETPKIDTDYRLLEHSFGFSSLIVTSRSDIIDGYIEVSNEVEFLDALLQADTKVIEIKSDLNLGSIEVNTQLVAESKSLTDYRSIYRPHSRQPLMHPILKESGIGVIRLILREDLMIYSKTGHKIKHASFLIDGSSNIVIRNLHLTELWEWDEITFGDYDRNDWDYFTIEKSNGIWLDHLTFDQAYDGIVDVKESGQNITLSWSKLNFKPNDFIQAQIDDLEENIESNPYYKSIRDSGVSKEDMVIYASFQKKGFNLGNSTDGTNFETITFTFHHLEIYNLMDRLPRIRKGDAHLYHIYLDNYDLYQLRNKHLSKLRISNQGIVTTEDGAVLMEHSIFNYVTTPIRSHQDSRLDIKYTGKYQVVHSELRLPARDYFGSSDDRNTIWIRDNTHEIIPFEFRNHKELPYTYQLQDVFFLNETFENYPTGHQTIDGFDWLKINENIET